VLPARKRISGDSENNVRNEVILTLYDKQNPERVQYE